MLKKRRQKSNNKKQVLQNTCFFFVKQKQSLAKGEGVCYTILLGNKWLQERGNDNDNQ